MSSRLFTLVSCLLLAGAAHAGAREDVMASMQQFVALKSYHATMTTTSPRAMTTEMDFVAPDRYRISTPAGTQYIVGDTMVLSIQGRSMRVPMPKGTLSQWRDPANLRKNAEGTTVTALAPGLVDGKPARKYRVVNSRSPDTSSVMWIGPGGYPLRMDVSSKTGGKSYETTIRYSRFNDPTLKVSPPG